MVGSAEQIALTALLSMVDADEQASEKTQAELNSVVSLARTLAGDNSSIQNAEETDVCRALLLEQIVET